MYASLKIETVRKGLIGKRVLSLSKKLNKGMGLARGICNTNAKPAIKTEERVIRKQNSVKLSLFAFYP